MKKILKRKLISLLVYVFLFLANITLIILVVFSVVNALNRAEDAAFSQNVENIQTITDAASDKVTLTTSSYTIQLGNAAYNINNYNGVGMTENEVKAYFSTYYTVDESTMNHWQLIGNIVSGNAFTGIMPATFDAATNNVTTISYETIIYEELAQTFSTANASNLGKTRYVSDFRNAFRNENDTNDQVFASTCTVRIRDEITSSYTYWTLMNIIDCEEIGEIIADNGTGDALLFDDFSNSIIDSDGNFVVKADNADFVANNFITELGNNNNGNFDEAKRNELREELAKTDNAALEPIYKKNVIGKDYIYTLVPIDGSNNWYMLSAVPLSSFHSTYDFNSHFIRFAIFFSALFFLDVVLMLYLYNKLRKVMIKEKFASEAKGNFMSRMSHEIRTPLNAIIGYNTIAKNDLTEVKDDISRREAEMKVLDCLTKMEIASKHLLTIINDVLDMSAIESGKIKIAHEKFNFKSLINSITTVFYSQAKVKGVNLEVIINTLTEEWFIGDQMRTSQILTNLLSNAIKFSDEGGSVTLSITQPEPKTNSTHLHFEVADTGIGMSQEYISHIWTPFEQADSSISRRYGGTGLGLSITKHLVDIMGGEISVTSELGTGSTFCVDLTYESVKDEQVDESYNFNEINALVVDDNVSTCDYIQLLFNRCGAKSFAVNSGEAAIAEIERSMKSNRPYSICLVDWRMPKMDGIETIKRIREVAGNKIPMVVLTAYDFSEIVDKAKEIGVNKFISKPLFQSSLFDLLVNICGKPTKKTTISNKAYDFKGVRVLLAEDNGMSMEIAQNLLSAAGLIVQPVWNGREAVKTFVESKEGTFKAILMDIHMPEMNGLDATREIRSSSHPQASSIPIIAMTADAFVENIAETKSAGMNAHVSKPIDLKVLLQTIKSLINKDS